MQSTTLPRFRRSRIRGACSRRARPRATRPRAHSPAIQPASGASRTVVAAWATILRSWYPISPIAGTGGAASRAARCARACQGRSRPVRAVHGTIAAMAESPPTRRRSKRSSVPCPPRRPDRRRDLHRFGMPDYRDADGRWKRAAPMTSQAFSASEGGRRRYWARSLLGWPRVAAAVPSAAHRALARVEARVAVGCWSPRMSMDSINAPAVAPWSTCTGDSIASSASLARESRGGARSRID